MKRTGIVLIVIGLLLTIFTSFGFLTKKKIVDIGELEITTSQPHRVKWTPYLGVAIMVVGGVMVFAGKKKLL